MLSLSPILSLFLCPLWTKGEAGSVGTEKEKGIEKEEEKGPGAWGGLGAILSDQPTCMPVWRSIGEGVLWCV